MNYWEYFSFIINSMLISIKATLSSELTFKIPDTDYGNTQIHDSRVVQHMSWIHCLKPLQNPTSSW